MNRKRLLALLLAVVMVLSLIPTVAFAEDQCTTPEVCTAEGHAEGCALYVTPDPATCTGDDSCTVAEGHTEGCPKSGSGDEGGENTPVCTCGTETDEHSEGCALAAGGSADTPTPCSKDEKCTQSDGHDGDCVIPPACTGDMSCTLTEGHSEGCQKAARDAALAECTRAGDCAASVHHADCAKDMADKLALCDGLEACPAELHNEGCLKAKADQDAAELAKCDKGLTCPAGLHHEDCEYALALANCTGAEGCEATVHKDICPLYVWPCDKTEACKATDHEEDCPIAIKAAAQKTFDEMVAALPAPETVDPLDEEMLQALHGQIQAIVTFALENKLYETQDEVTSLPVIAALLDAMQPKNLAVEMDGYTLDFAWYIGKEEEETFEISTIGQLAAFAKMTQQNVVIDKNTTVTKTSFSEKTVKLANSLAFGEDEYWYVKDASNTVTTNFCIYDFAGIFDGNSNAISGLKMKADSGTSQIGLFKNIAAGGSITGLTLDGVRFDLTDGNSSIGSIAGQFLGTATNCHVKNMTVVVGMRNENRGYIAQGGGLFGYVYSATVTGCTSTNVSMTFSGTDNTDRVGALIGQVDGEDSSRSKINNCHVYGSKFVLTMKAKYFGGFVGQTHDVDVTNCTISGIDISITNYGYFTGGFVGRVGSGSVFDSCKVLGGTITVGSTSHGSCVGGFAGYTDANPAKFSNCSVSDLDITIACVPGLHGQAGGLIGRQDGAAVITNCSASGTITTTGEGDINSSVGGLIGDTRANLTATGCDASGMTIKASDTNANAGGLIGRINERNGEKTVTLTNCTGASSVTSGGAAGGLAGYMDFSSTVTFDGCTPTTEANVSGTLTDPVANVKDGAAVSDSDGKITFTKSVCSGTVNGYATGYSSIQAAVDAGANEITLLQDVGGDFTLERTKDDAFVLNLGNFTFNGIVHIHHAIRSFGVTGETDEGSSILFTDPLGMHDVFDYWCSGSNNVAEKPESSGNYWVAAVGKTYHIHSHASGFVEIEENLRHLDLGRMAYNTATVPTKSITFTYTGSENATISGFEENDYFVGSGNGTLTATFQPREGLPTGVYTNIPIYVNMTDGSSHEVWLNLVVTGLASQVEPVPDPEADPAAPVVVNGIYGDTITLKVQVSKASQSKPKGRIAIPAVDTAAFYYGQTLLGEVVVDYDQDNTATTGSAALDYDTDGNGIPVGDGQIVTVTYGGSINLLASTGTITVNLKPRTIAADGSETINGVGITGPGYYDQDNAYVTEDGKMNVNGSEYTVESGTVTVKKDGSLEIPKDASVTTPDGTVITGPATVSADGKTVTVQTGGKIEIGGEEYTVTDGPVIVDNGKITVPEGSSVSDGKNTIAGPTTVDPDDTTQEFPEGSKVTVGDTTVEVTEGTVTKKEDGSIEIPEDATVTVGGSTITGPAVIDPDGDITVSEGGSVTNGNTTVEVEEGFVSVDGNGTVTIPKDTTVTVGDATITGPGTVDPDGDVTVNEGGSVTLGDSTVTVTDGSVSVGSDGTVTIPTGSTVIVDGKPITGPAAVGKDGIEVFYKITYGAGQTVTKGNSATFISNAPFAKFAGVLVDGKTVAASNYTAVSSSTKVTLKASYISTLSAGEHTLTIVSADGDASTTFTVKNKAASTDPDVPQTGDSQMPVLWIVLFLASAFGAIAALIPKRRKGKYQR